MSPTSSPALKAPPAQSADRDVQLLHRAGEIGEELRAAVQRRIVGQQHIVDSILTAMMANGHVLLVGVPGLAKTLIISTLSEALHLKFTPDPVHPPDPECPRTSPAPRSSRRTS